MTDDEKLMNDALAALENGKRVRNGEGGTKYQPDLEDTVMTALRERLAQPEQEPVAGKPLPCPFCGVTGLCFADGSTYRWGIASCGNCGATAGETRREYPDKGEWHKEAIEQWNQRTAPQPLTDEQDAKRWQFLRSAGDDVTLRIHNSRGDLRDSVIDAAIELRKAAEQSLKALEEYQSKGAPFMSCDAAVNALRTALAQPEQKPEPPQRKPLTKDEIRDGARKIDPGGEDLCSWSFECGVRFAELALGIKGDA